MYQPDAGDEFLLSKDLYRFSEHPALPGSGFAYGQEGRAGIVFQLVNSRGPRLSRFERWRSVDNIISTMEAIRNVC
jgi:hypothetical protein